MVAIIAWAVGIPAFIGLVVLAHREQERPWWRVGLVIVSAGALLTVTAGTPLVLAFLALNAALVLITWRLGGTRFWWVWVVAVVALLVVSKLPLGGSGVDNPVQASRGLWIGFSYLAFRLIHVAVDRHSGRLGDVTLPEVIIYALHPASIVSGPIDRARPSAKAQRQSEPLRESLRVGLWRILRGLFLKFVIANTLFSFIQLNDMARDPDRAVGVAWLWLVAYSFYLFTDFAAYTEIAIGFGRLAGLTLPETFTRPYLSPSPTVFWQRWHMSLSFWVRDYIFFPIARTLRQRYPDDRWRAPIQFVAHMTTMGAVGLWHGLTPNFLVWGLWHGLGLFIHGQIGGRPKPRKQWERIDHIKHAANIAGTYLFVTLGWVFFAADQPTALRIFARLIGLSV
ncbi:MAG: MBOAT family O-acyltransferase [Anaerolineae bacterium]